MTDEEGKLPSRKRELFILYSANMRIPFFSIKQVELTVKRKHPLLEQETCDKLVTRVPEVPCYRLKPKFSKLAVSMCVRILAKMTFVSCRESIGCFHLSYFAKSKMWR